MPIRLEALRIAGSKLPVRRAVEVNAVPLSLIIYYGRDQIGAVRRIFGSTPSAPAYSHDRSHPTASKAGHMTANDRMLHAQNSCRLGAIHT